MSEDNDLLSDISSISMGSTQDPPYIPPPDPDSSIESNSQSSAAPDFDLGSSPHLFGSDNLEEELFGQKEDGDERNVDEELVHQDKVMQREDDINEISDELEYVERVRVTEPQDKPNLFGKPGGNRRENERVKMVTDHEDDGEERQKAESRKRVVAGVYYKPETQETSKTYEVLLFFIQEALGDQPRAILAGAADKVLVTLKNDEKSLREKKRETESFLGALAEERFALLVNLGKKITDFGHNLNVGKDEVIDESHSISRKRVKAHNLHLDPEEHIRQQIPNTTKKATVYAVNLYNSTMKEVAQELSFQHFELKDVSVEDLPWRLSKFIMVVTKTDGKSFNASSLETIFASLARYLATDFTPKLDIKKDVRFKVVMNNLNSAKRESVKEGQRPGKNKARAFKQEHIALCWEGGSFGRDKPRALISTVQLILISNLGFRANLEVYNILNEDIVVGPKGKGGDPEWIEISERITKTRSGKAHDMRDLDQKVYADPENPATCPVKTLMEFRRRKTVSQKLPHKPYLLGIKHSAEINPAKEEYWYTSKRMGTHTIAKLLPNAFEEVGVDVKLERYSNTSGRKTMMEGGVDAGVPAVLLSKVAGQAALSSIQHYVEGQSKSHKALSWVLSRKAGGVTGARFEEVVKGINTQLSTL